MHPALTASLLAHGIEATPQQVQEAVLEALERHGAVLAPRGTSGLSAHEVEELRAGGFDLEPRALGKDDPHLAAIAEHAAILRTALTTAEVARHLGVTEARVRQRLQKRSLFGFEAKGGWRVPGFQFTAEGEVPGWAEVAQELSADLTPAEVLAWLTLPNSELTAGDEETPLSPRDWLLSGRSARAVAELAKALG